METAQEVDVSVSYCIEIVRTAENSVAPTPTTLESINVETIPSSQTKYSDLLARYYALKKQHVLAAHVLLRLIEGRSTDVRDVPTLKQRCQYLSNAVLQGKNASNSGILLGSVRGTSGNGLLDLLEGKFVVLRFQIKIKGGLEAIVSRLKSSNVTSESVQNESCSESNLNADTILQTLFKQRLWHSLIPRILNLLKRVCGCSEK